MFFKKLYQLHLLCGLMLMSILYSPNLLANTDNYSDQSQLLVDVLKEVSEKYQIFFTYEAELLKDVKVHFEFKPKESFENAIDRLLTNTGFESKSYGDKYVVIYKNSKRGKKGAKKLGRKIQQLERIEEKEQITIQRQSETPSERFEAIVQSIEELAAVRTIMGNVEDEEGNPLVGVTVVVKGTSSGTVTDANGQFSLEAEDGEQTLVFSYVGYQQLEIVVNNESVVDVTLKEASAELDEVVVIGYGTQTRRDVTGAVSSVQTEDVQRAVTNSAEELFQGRVSGVTVSQSSNAPGGGITVRVRGTSSISGGNDPLYVIDGIPVANSDQQSLRNRDLRFAGGNNLSPLALLNPQDIESIEILKDASATAIYGARGANGVVIITTKKGKAGAPQMEFSTSYGIQEATLLPELLNGEQFVALNDEARANAGRDLIFNGQLPPFETDWQDELFQLAPVQNHSLSVRGGRDATTYAFSFGYFNQEGAVRGTGLERFSGRLNVESQVNKWFKTGINVTMSRVVQNNSDVSSSSSVIRTVSEMLPIAPVRIGNEWFVNADMIVEDFDFGIDEANISSRPNPIFQSTVVKNEGRDDRVLGSVFGEISFSPDLKFRTTLGSDIVNGRLFFFNPTTAVTGNNALNRYYNSTHWSIQNQLTYQKAFAQHNITITGVQSVERFRNDRLEALAENIPDATENFNFNGDTRLANDKFPGAENWSIASFLGRANYNYAGKYLLTASVRYDGSSRFGDDTRWGLFPAVSAGWVISQEGFFGVDAVSFLKLRAGWGVNGNQDIGAFLYESLIRGRRAIIGGDLFPGIEPSNIPNSALGWESTEQLNVGLDAGFLEDRLTFSFNVYDKLTSDLLFRTNLPLTSGHSNIVLNIGEVRNRGWELEMGGYLVRNNNFSWQSDFNFSQNENEVEELDGVVEELIQGSSIIRPGLSLGTIFGYRTDGLWQESDDIAGGPMPGALPGDRKYVDINGDNVINSDDRVVLGASIPRFSYGFNNTFTFKGLQLNVFLQGLGGLEKLNNVKNALENTSGTENTSTRVLDRWTPTNTDTQVQRATQAGRENVPPRASTNDYFVEDASFWRLKNVSVAYSLPQSVVSKLRLGSIRLALTGQNLATFTDFTITDPEAAVSERAYPLVRSYTFALNLGF